MKYGRKKINLYIDSKRQDAIIIALPSSPINIHNEFLRNYYKNSKAPNSPTNIRNRWKHAVATLFKIKKYLNEETKLQMIFNYFLDRSDEKIKSDIKFIEDLIDTEEKSNIKIMSSDIVYRPELKQEFILILITSKNFKFSLKNREILIEMCKVFEL